MLFINYHTVKRTLHELSLQETSIKLLQEHACLWLKKNILELVNDN